MKKFFQRSKHSSNAQPPSNGSKFATAPFNAGHTITLGPKFSVPPVPHPSPHSRIAILAADKGLLLRPVIPGASHTGTCIQIRWGKGIDVTEVQQDFGDSSLSWDDAVTIEGVLGFLKLYTCVYLV